MTGQHWQDLIAHDALEPNDVTAVEVGRRVLAVYDGKAGISVSDARCTHAGANLCDGYFDGKAIECPLHQALFDCVTGKALAAPAVKPLKMYESRIRDGRIEVLLPG